VFAGSTAGSVSLARSIALLLRKRARHVRVLILDQAMSAGTMLCLAANEIVMGTLSKLGPIDPHIMSAGTPPPGSPPMISAEDIRAFRRMAEDWFGVQNEEHRAQMLGLLCQRIFPTTISSFYRSEQQMRRIAGELIRYQLPDAREDERRRVVDHLMTNYGMHDYFIDLEEAQRIGLRVVATTPEEEGLLWRIRQTCESYMRKPVADDQSEQKIQVSALIVSIAFAARYRMSYIEPTALTETDDDEGESLKKAKALSFAFDDSGWEIVRS
jgi:hypothetical protein